MLILVPRECSSSGKSLLAIDVRTFVRSLARVDSSVSREGAGVAEGLGREIITCVLLQ